MNQILILILLTLTAFTYAQKRKIQTCPNCIEWMTEEEIQKQLVQKKKHFVDITDGHLDRINPVRPFSNEFPQAPKYQKQVNKLIQQINIPDMKKFLGKFTNFKTRYYRSIQGKQSAEWLYSTISNVINSANRSDLHVSLSKFDNPWGQFSIIVKIEKVSSPVLMNQNQDLLFDKLPKSELQRVIIGAHLDSVNQYNPWWGTSPGADDDGSGCTTILQTLKIYLNSKLIPKRPLEFHFYSAEEGGLLGSQRIVADYVNRGIPVLSMYQIDMTGYSPPNASPIIGIATDNVSPLLGHVLQNISSAYSTIPWKDVECGYGCSDHFSWYKAGIDSIFTFEASFNDHSPYIHTAQDDISKIDFEHVAEFVKVALGYVVELPEIY